MAFSKEYGGVTDMVFDPDKYRDVRGKLRELQTRTDKIVEDAFISDLETKGWRFTDDAPWGIPPVNND